MSSFFIIILALLTVVLGVLVLADWRRGVVFLFVCLYVENFIRVALPDKPPHVLIIKEIIVGFTYLSYFGSKLLTHWKLNLPPRLGIFLLTLPTGIIGLVSGFNNSYPIALIGLGIKGYYWYIPIVLLGYEYFRQGEALRKFLKIIVLLSIPLLAFAIFQYVFWDMDSPFIRPLKGGFHSASLIDVPLIPGLFGSHARFARVGFCAFMLGLPFILIMKQKRDYLFLGAIVAAFACFMMTGYRTTMVVGTIGGLLFFYTSSSTRNLSRVIGFVLVLFIGVGLIIYWRGDVRAFLLLDTKSELVMRPIWTTQSAREGLEKHGPFGFGLGTMSQGIDYLLEPEDKPQVTHDLLDWYESGIARVAFETGLVGLLGWLAFLAFFLARCRGELLNQPIAFNRHLALAIFLFVCGITVEFTFIRHQTFQDATTMVLFWFFVGVLYRLKTLSC